MVGRKLSALSVRSLGPGRYTDAGCTGLLLQVATSGARSWLLRVVANGRRREIGLGPYPLVSLAEAREKATELRRAAWQGHDPKVVRDRGKPSRNRFRDVAKRYFEEHVAPRSRNVKISDRWWNGFEVHVFPDLGEQPVEKITRSDLAQVLAPLVLAKPETGRKLRQRLKALFGWALAHELIASSPMESIEHALPRPRNGVSHYKALSWPDAPEFYRRLTQEDGMGALALRFAILTASRSCEVRGATWDEIDESAGAWTIPPDRMKTGKQHRVPLSSQALGLIVPLRALRSDLIFPGAKPGRPLSDMTLTAVLRRMGRTDIQVHGFRSTFRDWAAEQAQAPRELAEAALAHTIGSHVERAYARGDLFDRRRNLMQAWSDFVGA